MRKFLTRSSFTRNFIKPLAIALTFIIGGARVQTVQAQDLLSTAATSFVSAEDRFKRVGIEMEMSGLSFKDLEREIRKHYTILKVEHPSKLETHLYISEGVIKLKIEGQAWRYEGDDKKYAAQLAEDIRVAPREIVFPPLTYQRASTIQALATDLEKAGAIGTSPDLAVAFQVNYEFGQLREDPRRVQDLVNVLRTYYDVDNMKQIDELLQVPGSRREFLGDLTPGFRKKLFNPGYTPSLEEFFEDYLYRQSAERFGYRNAWSDSTETLRSFLKGLPDPVHPSVIKMQRIRVSSLLLEAFPDDWLVKTVVASKWAVPAPIIEFREFNMVFGNVERDIRASIGLVGSVKKYGYYKHDVLMSALSGVPTADFPKIRAKVRSGEPFVLRYLLEDPKHVPRAQAEKTVAGSHAIWTQLDPNHPGRVPLTVGGESIVFNRRHIHRSSLVGKYNPGLDHGYIQQVLENKLTEAKLFKEYAPGSMPRFVALSELPSMGKNKTIPPEEAFKAATAHFKNGWVMKGSWDLGSEKSFISNNIDIGKAMAAYRNGFEAHFNSVQKKNLGADPEYINLLLKQHPGYQGWKIQNMLETPNQVFFQEMIPIDREFRVEALNGKVISGATIDRYAYLSKKAIPPKESELRAIEEYTQKILDQLPNELKVLPYGLDVARLKTGGFSIIETNPGGNSSFLEESPKSVRALEDALIEYRAMAKAGNLHRLNEREEMLWIKKTFQDLKISPAKDYPGMTFMGTGIMDSYYLPTGYCSELLHPTRLVQGF